MKLFIARVRLCASILKQALPHLWRLSVNPAIHWKLIPAASKQELDIIVAEENKATLTYIKKIDQMHHPKPSKKVSSSGLPIAD